jgi:hypothetical protein
MDGLPDATQPDHPQVQDDVSASNRPRHPRAFAPLREDSFIGGLGAPATKGQIVVVK